MRTWLDHQVLFVLDEDEQFVVPQRSGRGYLRVDRVTVTLPEDRPPRVTAGGIRCRKDGTDGKGWGRTSMPADVDEAEWIAKAREVVG